MAELEKPRAEQVLTVDHVLETTRGVELLVKKGAIPQNQTSRLTRAIIGKFRSKVEKSTVAPRMLAKIARAYERRDVEQEDVQEVAQRLIGEKTYSISAAYADLAVDAEESRRLEVNSSGLQKRLEEHIKGRRKLSPEARSSLKSLAEFILRSIK